MRVIAWIGVVAFVVSWVAPVVEGQGFFESEKTGESPDIPKGVGMDVVDRSLSFSKGPRFSLADGPRWLPGWFAFQAAWENLITGGDALEGRRFDEQERDWKNISIPPTGGPWLPRVLGATCLTNGLMVLAVVVMLRRRSAHRVLGLLMLAAAGLNASWLYLTSQETRDALRIGYYLWLGSFALVGIGLVLGSTSRRETDTRERTV